MRLAFDLQGWRERLAVGVRQNAAGHPVLAERTFTRLLRDIERAGDDERDTTVIRARAYLGRGASTCDRRGDVEVALRDIDTAAALAHRVGADHVLAAVHGQRALVALSMGRTTEALSAFDDAVELLDKAEPYDQMCLLLNRGALHLENGSLAAARRDLARCAALAASGGDRVLEFKARHNLGYVEFLAGNLPRALAEMAAAAELDAGGPWPTALLDQARVLREAGLLSEADAALRSAEKLFRRDGVAQGVAEVLLARAECELTSSPDSARLLAADARRRFRRRGNLRWERRAEHLLLVADLAGALSGTKDGDPSRRLRALARHAADVAAACAAERREDLARSARLAGATALLAAGDPVPEVPELRRQDQLGIRLQAREVRARAARAGGNGRAARAEVKAGLEEVCAYQARFGSLDMRTASAVHGVALARLDLDLALETGRAATIFASLERTRAASSRLTPVHPPADDREAALLSELRLVEEEARGLEGAADPSALARLERRAADLRAAVRAGAWRREGTRDRGAVRAAAPLDAVREHLAATGTTLVSVTAHRGRLHAVVVDDHRVRHHVLASAEAVDELIHRTRSDLDVLALPMIPAPVRPTVTRSLIENLQRLDDLLVAPLDVPEGPLVVCPSGLLGVLPWGMLPSRRGLPVVVTPSTSSWHAAGVAAPAGPPPRVATIAGPGLGRAAGEATAVSGQWAGDALTHASSADAIAAFGGYDLVHVAAHGRHEADNPFFSSVRLADGPLFAHELESVDRLARCFVLSACEVGQWTVRPGNEPLGLTTALLQLGAHCVVAGVARVGDDAAADVMVRMHGLMATGQDTATALATAQAEATTDGVVAPFVCFGSSWAGGASSRTRAQTGARARST